MTNRPAVKTPPYDARSQRKSRTLLYLLLALIGFAASAFALLYAFGRNFGVPV